MRSPRFPLLAALVAAATLADVSSAADLQLPRPSQKAQVMQTVGLTDVTITYSRPGVKGRVIWGGLVPYDKVWRTGANEATDITFSTDVKVNGKPLPAGTYSIHTIPTKKDWTVIFNKKADQWGSYSYDEAEDALRVQVKTQPHEFTEWMEFSLPDIAVDKATVALDWEKLRVPFEIQVETVELALANARAAMASLAADDWQTAYRCASFAFQNNVALDEAWQWLDKSISIKETWLNLRLKADVLAKEGKTAEAIQSGEKAIAVGQGDAPADEIAKIEKQVAEWKSAKK
jgi:hypothetical protein